MKRSRYPKDWDVISKRIRFDRARGRCECTGECGLHVGRRCHERDGEYAEWARGKVVLTTAHRNHAPMDCRDTNLLAMCQRCHLRYDSTYHATQSRYTRRRKLAHSDLFEGEDDHGFRQPENDAAGPKGEHETQAPAGRKKARGRNRKGAVRT